MYLLYFFLYSFLGWLLETCYASLRRRRYCSKQTLLRSPLCPIYGLGALSMLTLLTPISDAPLTVFCGGFFLGSGIEYLIGHFYLYRYGLRRWDYSACFGNLGGLVCVFYSLLWGVLALVLLYGLHPLLARLTPPSPMRLYPVLLLGTVWFCTDFRETLHQLDLFSEGKESLIPQRLTYVTKS